MSQQRRLACVVAGIDGAADAETEQLSHIVHGCVMAAQMVQQRVPVVIGQGRVQSQLQQSRQYLATPGRHTAIIGVGGVILQPVEFSHS